MKKTIHSLFAASALLTTAMLPQSQAADLLAGGLKQWNLAKAGAWEVTDGVLGTTENPGGYIWSKKKYADFEITLDYKTSEKCNSGLFFRTDPKNAVQGGFEIQIASDGLYSKNVLEADIDDWTTANKNPDGTKNKFKTALKDLPRTGHLGLQYHGHPVWFRNIKLKKL